MPSEIIVVYQDCVLCGDRGKKIKEIATKAGVKIRKLSFACVEGQEHCMKAIEAGVKTMPFYTDGKIYAPTLETLLEAESKAQNERDEVEPIPAKVKTTKRTRKTKTTKKELNDGPVE